MNKLETANVRSLYKRAHARAARCMPAGMRAMPQLDGFASRGQFVFVGVGDRKIVSSL